MTLNGLIGLTAVDFTEFGSFLWADFVKVVEDTRMLSAAEM